MRNDELLYELREKIKDFSEIFDSYANFSSSELEFVNSVWLNAEILAKKFRARVVELELESLMAREVE